MNDPSDVRMHPPPHTLSDYAMYIRKFSMGCTRTHVHDKKWSVSGADPGFQTGGGSTVQMEAAQFEVGGLASRSTNHRSVHDKTKIEGGLSSEGVQLGPATLDSSLAIVASLKCLQMHE